MRCAHRPYKPRARGFTLLETMIVLFIVSLLSAAIAVSFAGVLSSSRSRAADVVLSTADTAARQLASENTSGYSFPIIGQLCGSTTAGQLSLPGPGFSVTSGASAGPSQVSVCTASGGSTVYMALTDKDGACFALVDTIIGASLPPGVVSSATTTTPAQSGPFYGWDPAPSTQCSAEALYSYTSGGGKVSSTDPTAPTKISL